MLIKFFAYLRDFTGCKSTELQKGDFPDGEPDVRELACLLMARFPRLRGRLLDSDGTELHEEIIIMVDGRRVEHIGGLGARIGAASVVSIFPVVAGG